MPETVSYPSVKIIVSCHKPGYVPSSSVYVPVLGGSFEKKPIPGMVSDATGENISSRNFTFCELSAQYWAWKNLDADYIGMCHYRRFFAFDPVDIPANDHAQIELPTLSDKAAHDLRLDDTDLIVSEVAKAEITTGRTWNVVGVATPGKKSTSVAEHMMAYGLFDREDLDVLADIVRRLKPDYYDDFVSYTTGTNYLGYNCFVMKKEAFDELCEFEFDVLLAFDRQKDYTHLTRTKKRICGYFGEILYSTFITRCRRERRYSIAEKQLLFFQSVTPSLKALYPQVDDRAVDIIWRWPALADKADERQRRYCADAVAVSMQSLIDSCTPEHSYRVVNIHDPRISLSDVLCGLNTSIPRNMILSETDWLPVEGLPSRPSFSEDELCSFLPILVPYFLPNVSSKIIWVDGLPFFYRDPALLLDAARLSTPFVSMRGISFQAAINDPAVAFSSEGLLASDSIACVDPSLAVIDLDAAREGLDLGVLASSYRALHIKGLSAADARHLALGIAMGRLDSIAGSLDYNAAAPAAPMDYLRRWANADELESFETVREPIVRMIAPDSSVTTAADYAGAAGYWKLARSMPVYERLLSASSSSMQHSKRGIVEKLLPPGSKLRTALGRTYRRVHDR